MLTVNELFAGIGAFRKSLIRLGIPHEVVGISEIDKYAIKSYNAIYGETRNSPIESDTVLMDKLEPVEDIDEKYFLSSECVKRRFTKNQINEEKGYGFKFSPVEREEAKIATTVTTIPTRDTANHITEKGVSSILEDNVDERYYLSDEMSSKLIEKPTDGIVRQVGYIKKTENGTQHQSNTVYDPNGAARTLTACDYKSPMMIKE